MDSPNAVRPRPAAPAEAGLEAPGGGAVEAPGLGLAAGPSGLEAAPGALARLGRMLPGVSAVVRAAYRTAGASAVAAVLIVAAVADVASAVPAGLLVVLALVLMVPAGALALAGWTLADLAGLPRQLRDAALAATGRASPGAASEASRPGGSRLLRLVRSLWAARGLALLTRDGWLKAVGAVRFVRLASLPFALALIGAVGLNAVVILGGIAALAVLLL